MGYARTHQYCKTCQIWIPKTLSEVRCKCCGTKFRYRLTDKARGGQRREVMVEA